MKYVCTKGGKYYLPSFSKGKRIGNNITLGYSYTVYEMDELYLYAHEVYEIEKVSTYKTNDNEYKYILKTEQYGDWYISQTVLDKSFRKSLPSHCKVLMFDTIEKMNEELENIRVDELIDVKITSDDKYMVIRKVKGDIE